jgi:hypothetical protein
MDRVSHKQAICHRPFGPPAVPSSLRTVRPELVQDGDMTDHDSDLESLIDRYCAAWSDPDPARRRDLLGGVFADDATYTDPTVHTTGVDELLAHIDTVLARRPGARVVRTSPVDAHHELARFAWHVVQPDGTAHPDGLDLAEFSTSGRIRRIVGFFGPLASVPGS